MRRRLPFSWAALAVLLGTLAVLASACGTGGSSGPLPTDQQILKIALNAGGQDISTLDPALTEDVYSFQAEQLIFPMLVTWDAHLNIIPWAAASLPTISSDGLTYTFKIRPGLKWSDGTAIDASTFAYSINRQLDPCTGSQLAGFFLAPIKGATAFAGSKCDAPSSAIDPTDSKSLIGTSIKVIDPLTLQIVLGAPATYFLAALSTSSAMATPKQLVTQYGLKDWINHLQGFGGSQYTLKLWDHRGALDFTANPNFWGGLPKLHEIDWTIYKDPKTGYTDYLNGRIEVASPSIDQYTSAKTRSDFFEGPALNINYIAPNWGVKPFDDVRVRQAFDLALDKTVLANNIEKGTVFASNHMIPQGNPGYNPNLTGPDGQVNDLSGNPTLARQLMQQYANQHCGGSFAKCPAINYYTTNDTGSLELSNAILDQWRTTFPGLNITETPETFPQLIKTITGGSPPSIWLIAYFVDYADPQDWTSLQTLPGAGNNLSNINDTQANALMKQGDVAPAGPARIALYQQAEQSLVTQVAWITLNQGKTFWVQSPKLHGFTFTANGFPTFSTWQNAYLTA